MDLQDMKAEGGTHRDLREAGPTRPGPPRIGAPRVGASSLTGLALLALLADLLFLDHPPGLPLAAFALALLAVVAATSGRLPGARDPAVAALLVLAVLPVVEIVQPLSAAAYGLLLLAALVRLRPGPGSEAAGVLAGLRTPARSYPVTVLADTLDVARALRRAPAHHPGGRSPSSGPRWCPWAPGSSSPGSSSPRTRSSRFGSTGQAGSTSPSTQPRATSPSGP